MNSPNSAGSKLNNRVDPVVELNFAFTILKSISNDGFGLNSILVTHRATTGLTGSCLPNPTFIIPRINLKKSIGEKIKSIASAKTICVDYGFL